MVIVLVRALQGVASVEVARRRCCTLLLYLFGLAKLVGLLHADLPPRFVAERACQVRLDSCA
jgi:hypothetical protein